MLKTPFLLILLWVLAIGCSETKTPTSLISKLPQSQGIAGKPDYLNSPFVTAGDRLYMVGHQNGSFPDLGWHIDGEMGGIWDHPIKLMDGFSVGINNGEIYWCLDKAESFVNFPFGNLHEYTLGERLKVRRFQFVPDQTEGLIVEFEITNIAYKTQVVSVDFSGLVDLRPTWLAERQQVEDTEDVISWNDYENVFEGQDMRNDWFVLFGGDGFSEISIGIKTQCDFERKGMGEKATITNELIIEQGKSATLRFYIAGSSQSSEHAYKTLKKLKKDPERLLSDKMERLDSIKSLADIRVPEPEIEAMYTWLKYSTDWLIRDVEGIGRGLSAGIPDYPWWFGADNCYSLQGLLATGRHDEVKQTIKLLIKLSNEVNGNGRIIHEASTNGEVYNPGNLNEPPHFIYLLWKYYQWTGDIEFLRENFPLIKDGLKWIENEDKDKNGYPDGPGMMEIQGLHTEMIDVVVYTQQAFDAASKIAAVLGDQVAAHGFSQKAQDLKARLDREWWVEASSSYADFRSTKPEALSLIDQAIVRADTIKKPWSVTELNHLKTALWRTPQVGTNGYVVHHNWVVNTPMEMGIADSAKAVRALETAANFRNRFGMYVTGIDRDENADETTKWKSFSYVGAVMTLPTGVQAIAEAQYQRPDEALRYLRMLRNSFSYALPGSMYEVSPDYGMIAQAWNIYAVAVPIVSHFFGIRPDAGNRKIEIRPLVPQDWANGMEIRNVLVGSNVLSYKRELMGERVRYTFSQREEDWSILFYPEQGNQILVNRKPASFENGYLTLTGKENEVEIVF